MVGTFKSRGLSATAQLAPVYTTDPLPGEGVTTSQTIDRKVPSITVDASFDRMQGLSSQFGSQRPSSLNFFNISNTYDYFPVLIYDLSVAPT